MDSYKPKLSKNIWDGSLSSPQYQISYGLREKLSTAMERSLDLRLRLFGQSALVIELDSNLLVVPEKEREDLALAFREGLKQQGIDFRYRTSPSTSRNSFLNRLLKTEREAHHVLALVPAEVWRSAAFEAIIPGHGLRYYGLPALDRGEGLLDQLYQGQLRNKEIIDRFDMIIYDVPAFGQMGLISSRKSFADIQNLVG